MCVYGHVGKLIDNKEVVQRPPHVILFPALKVYKGRELLYIAAWLVIFFFFASATLDDIIIRMLVLIA